MADKMSERLSEVLKDVDGAADLPQEVIDALNTGFETGPENVAGDADGPADEDAAAAEAVAAADAAAAADDESDGDDGENVDVSAAIAKAVSDKTKDIEKRLNETVTELAKEREERGIASTADGVRKNLNHLGIDDTDAFGATLYRAKSKLDIADFEAIAAVLARASSLAGESAVLTEVGTAEPGEDSPEGVIAKIVKEQTDDNDGRTPQQRVRDAVKTPFGEAAYGESIRY